MSEKTKQVQRLMLASQKHVHEGNVELIPDFSELEGDFLRVMQFFLVLQVYSLLFLF